MPGHGEVGLGEGQLAIGPLDPGAPVHARATVGAIPLSALTPSGFPLLKLVQEEEEACVPLCEWEAPL